MNIQLSPASLRGTVAAIPSKSDVHRLLICAALADKPTRLCLTAASEDIDATINCLCALGADIEQQDDTVWVHPIDRRCTAADTPVLDCRESGSTVRFLLPVAAAIHNAVFFKGSGRLPERPLDALLQAMQPHGVTSTQAKLPLQTVGRLRGGAYVLPGNISSQYLTGLLLALPLLREDSSIHLTTALESAAYVDLTLQALRRFGIQVTAQANAYWIPGGQQFCSPGEVVAEGDWSNAAFFLAAGAMGASVSVTGLQSDSAQGDRRVLTILQQMGATVLHESGRITVTAQKLKGIAIDIREIPDLLPPLAVAAACAEGTTQFTGGARLRLKESDRLASTAAMLHALGIQAEEQPDGLTVYGNGSSGLPVFTGGIVDSCHDHRIVMAAAIAALRADAPVTILDAGAVQKSYPAFFTQIRQLGGTTDVI